MGKILSILLSVAIMLSCIGIISFAQESTDAVKLISDAASTLEGQSSVPSEITITAGLTSQTWRLSLAEDATYGKVVWWRGSTAYTYAGPQWAYADNLNSYLAENDAEKYIVTISAKVKYVTDDGSGSATDKCLTFGFRSSSGMDGWGDVIGYNTWVDASATKELTKAEVQALTSSKLTFDGYTKAANSGTDKAVFFDSVQMTIETVEEEGGEVITPTENNLISTGASNFEGQTSIPSDISYVGTVASWRMGLADDAVQGKALRYRCHASDTYSGPQWAYADALNSYLAENDFAKYKVTISAKVKYVTSHGSGTLDDECLSFGLRNSAGMDSWGRVKGYNAWVEASFTKELTKAEVQALTSAKLTFDGYRKAAYSDSTTEKAIFFDDIKLVIENIEEEVEPTTNLISTGASNFEGQTSIPNDITYVGTVASWRMGLADDAVQGKVLRYRRAFADTWSGPQWAYSTALTEYLAENESERYVVTISAKVKYVTSDGSGSADEEAMKFGFRNGNSFTSWGEVLGFNNWVDVSYSKILTRSELEALVGSTLTFDAYTKDAYSDSTTEKAIFYDDIKMIVEVNDKNIIKGATLDIGSTLTINYFADLDDAHKDAVLKVTRNDATVELNGVYDEEYGMYKFAYTGINPQCMVDNVSASLVFDGEVISEKAEYSVKNYFANIKASDATKLGITDAQYNALIALANDTLIYGREAQKHMNYNLTELATDGFTWITEDVTTLATPNELFKSVTNTDANNKVASATLNISNTVKVLYRVKLANKNLTVKVNGVEAELVATGNANEYLVYSEALKATDFNKAYTITITDGANEISKVVYSVNDYIAYIAAKGETSSLYNVVKALNNYGISAVAFKNA